MSTIETIDPSTVSWGRGKKRSQFSIDILEAISYIDEHPGEAVVITVPADMVQPNARMSTVLNSLNRRGAFEVRRIDGLRYAIRARVSA